MDKVPVTNRKRYGLVCHKFGTSKSTGGSQFSRLEQNLSQSRQQDSADFNGSRSCEGPYSRWCETKVTHPNVLSCKTSSSRSEQADHTEKSHAFIESTSRPLNVLGLWGFPEIKLVWPQEEVSLAPVKAVIYCYMNSFNYCGSCFSDRSSTCDEDFVKTDAEWHLDWKLMWGQSSFILLSSSFISAFCQLLGTGVTRKVLMKGEHHTSSISPIAVLSFCLWRHESCKYPCGVQLWRIDAHPV